MNNIKSGRVFGKALCSHFGLPSGQVHSDVVVNNSVDDIFSVTITISITPDDLKAIGDLMDRMPDPPRQKPIPVHHPEKGHVPPRPIPDPKPVR